MSQIMKKNMPTLAQGHHSISTFSKAVCTLCPSSPNLSRPRKSKFEMPIQKLTLAFGVFFSLQVIFTTCTQGFVLRPSHTLLHGVLINVVTCWNSFLLISSIPS